MSSSERPRLPGAVAAAVLIAVAVVLAGCNVRPLYGTAPDGGNVRGELATIDVAPASGRVGQHLRNELLFKLNGGNPAASAYLLQLDVASSGSNIIVRRIGGQARGRIMRVEATFELVRPGDDVVVYAGRVTRQAALERSNQRFANDRAELDAEMRAAGEVAEEISLRLSAFFASGGAVVSRVPVPRDDGFGNEIEDMVDLSDDQPGDIGMD